MLLLQRLRKLAVECREEVEVFAACFLIEAPQRLLSCSVSQYSADAAGNLSLVVSRLQLVALDVVVCGV